MTSDLPGRLFEIWQLACTLRYGHSLWEAGGWATRRMKRLAAAPWSASDD